MEYDISRAFAVFPRDLRTSPYHYKHIKIYTLLRNTVTEYNNFQVVQHHVGFKRVFHYSESLIPSSFASTEKPYRIFVREKDRKSETSHKLIRFADFSTPRSSRSYCCPCISRVFPHTVWLPIHQSFHPFLAIQCGQRIARRAAPCNYAERRSTHSATSLVAARRNRAPPRLLFPLADPRLQFHY